MSELPSAAKAAILIVNGGQSPQADLLLLDPIHEVDAEGWPHPVMPDPGV